MVKRSDALWYLSSIENINSGGCLIAAYSVFLNELRNGNKNVRIHAIDIQYALNENLEFINNERKYPVSNRHYVWTYYQKGRFWDSRGVYDISSKFYDSLEIPLEVTHKFVELALKYGCWNKAFDRSYEVPKIETYFGIKIP